ncbi:MAG: ABC-type transport system involved in multi-copper enzyme maturation, permease component, partial [Verrucomicrobiales bacterium]|nr:ABC-type transport system involved in multi-copper enzyme maturation, permease component [Verrucomicrobiales bacterium]
FMGSIVVAYGIGGFSNYFLRRPFVADAVFAVAIMITLGFVILHFIPRDAVRMGDNYTGLDWRVIPASGLILLALLILAALALACSTRFEVIPTLAICSALFLLGLVSDYFWGAKANAGSWWGSVLYAITPNWQLFWMADALEKGTAIPIQYIAKAFAYAAGYIGAVLCVALVMFEDRELN